MNVKDAIAFFGSKSELARRLRISPQAVQQWERDGKIPIPRQYQIEVLTNKQLQAEVQHVALAMGLQAL